MLSEQEKQIVQYGVKAGKSPAEIESAVAKFREQGKATPQEPSMLQNVKDVGIGFAKGVGSTIKNMSDIGRKVTDPLLGALDPNKTVADYKANQAPVTDQMVTASNTAQSVGKTAELIAEFLIPIGKATKAEKVLANVGSTVASNASNIAKATKQATSGALPKLAKAVLGESDTALVKAGQNPAVKAFKSGEKKVSDVVKLLEDGIKGFETTSKAQLQAVKQAIPDIDVGAQRIGEVVNKGVLDSVQNSADYRGVKQVFETADDIIASGILKPEETQRLQKVMEFIGKWKDTSARGSLNLKEALSNFYATGENYTGSNAVIRSIQRNLVNLVSETAPEIKPALKIASQNIDYTDDLVRHLLGKDSVSGESKVLTLARSLKDSARSGYKLDLVRKLEKATGTQLEDELKALFDYLESSKLTAPGLQSPIESVKYGGKKLVEKYIRLE